MRKQAWKLAVLLSVIFAAAMLVPVHAAADDDDPPSRVARLSYYSGAVSFSPAGTDDWVTPVLNRPITTGDKLWTDRGARAEMSIGTAYIRLGEQTGFSFLNLDDRTTQIRITEGTINLRVRRLDSEEIVEVDTPNLAFNVNRPGSYRISVDENGDSTMIAVHDGAGDATGGGASYPLYPNQAGTFTGTDTLTVSMDALGYDDDFDRWCADRDARYERSVSSRYVSDDVIGYEDLDAYGGWRTVPDYGTVWFPHTTIVGWAPYRYGHWVWISPWGWTWVDDAPWGFAPFHYGRWVFVGGVWGWVPCPPRPRVVTAVYVRPVYAPALVAWVGGEHWGIGVTIGGGPAAGVAWFPLGPRDVYCPSYHVSQRYVERVNISNTTIISRTYVTNVYNTVYVNKTVNVTNIHYQNREVRGAVTATSRTVFTSAQPVGRNVIRVNEREITAAPIAPRSPALIPDQRSVAGAGGAARVRPPERVLTRPVVAKTAPPPPPVSFNRERPAIEAKGGRPLSSTEQSQLRRVDETQGHNVRMAPPTSPGVPRNVQSGRPVPPVQQPTPQPQHPQQERPERPQPPPQPQQIPDRRPEMDRPIQPVPSQAGQPSAVGNVSDRGRRYEDRPPAARPGGAPAVNPQLEQRQQQQMEQLRQQQDRERQRVEQRQVQEQQKLERQNVDQRRADQVRQQQQRQLEQMEQRHAQQAQKLEQKQQREAQKQQQREAQKQQREAPKPQKESKPPKPPSH